MKHLTLVILLALAPLSWGEEDVYYCVEEHSVELAPTTSGDASEIKRYAPERFTFKHEAAQNWLVFIGWRNSDEPYYMDCTLCSPEQAMFRVSNLQAQFVLMDGRFNAATIYPGTSEMRTGTCKRF